MIAFCCFYNGKREITANGELNAHESSGRRGQGLFVSASHMESAFAILLGLPCRLGGFDFPDFRMNESVAVPKPLIKQIGRIKLAIDLCWSGRKVVFEYDSMQHHHHAFDMPIETVRRQPAEAYCARFSAGFCRHYDCAQYASTALAANSEAPAPAALSMFSVNSPPAP